MRILAALILGLLIPPISPASEIEVLHWWTAGGEAKAANVFRSYWQALGNEWQDSAISGGGGKSAMTVLKSRALSGTPRLEGPAPGRPGRAGPREVGAAPRGIPCYARAERASREFFSTNV